MSAETQTITIILEKKMSFNVGHTTFGFTMRVPETEAATVDGLFAAHAAWMQERRSIKRRGSDNRMSRGCSSNAVRRSPSVVTTTIARPSAGSRTVRATLAAPPNAARPMSKSPKSSYRPGPRSRSRANITTAHSWQRPARQWPASCDALVGIQNPRTRRDRRLGCDLHGTAWLHAHGRE